MAHPRPRRSILGAVMFGVVLFAITSFATAQGAPGFHIGLSGGADFPVGDQENVYDMGWNGTLMFDWMFGTSPFGVRLDGSYHQLKVKNELEPLFLDGEARLLDGTFNFVFGPHFGGFQPYILGGVGIYDVRFSGQDVINGGLEFKVSDTRFGWNAGTGFAFCVSGDVHIFLEGRYHSIDLDRDRFVETNNRFEVVTANLGVVF